MHSAEYHGQHDEAICSCHAHTEPPEEEVSDEARLKDMKILIVDDADNMRLLLSEYLEGFGYTSISTAASANEAFNHLTADPDVPASDSADIILMDIVMPGIDGLEACRRIKQDMGCTDTPIVMVTGEDGILNLREAFEAGVMDYVTKPFNRFELHIRVESALKLKRAMDAQKRANSLLKKTNLELKEAISKAKVLRGLLPICSTCKKIRNSSGDWNKMEAYIIANSEAEFSHGVCPDCQKELYPEVYQRLQDKGILPR